MPGDEPTLRERAREAILSVDFGPIGDVPGVAIERAGKQADAVMDVVAPELERRDERIAGLEDRAQRWGRLVEVITAIRSASEPLPAIFATTDGEIYLEEQPAAVRYSLSIDEDGITVVIAGGGSPRTIEVGVSASRALDLLQAFRRGNAPAAASGNTETGTEGKP